MVMVCAIQVGCVDADERGDGIEGAIEVGDAVQFATYLPDNVATRATKEDWNTEIGNYKQVFRAYTFNIEMWKDGANAAVGSAIYKYEPTNTIVNPDDVAPENPTDDGTLIPADENKVLSWQDNVSKWGFKATAGSAKVSNDQSTGTKWLAQDKLEGYGYVPLWDDSKTGVDGYYGEYKLGEFNYRTSKQWYADNKRLADPHVMGDGNEKYRKIPLYLQHKRAWITVRLKAGEGVPREALDFSTSSTHITTIINSYGGGDDDVKIDKALSREYKISYPASANLPEQNNMSSTRYDAIVEPYNYAENKEMAIASITLNGQRFTFSADCDNRYATKGSDTSSAEYIAWEDAYNLTGGKHLTIDVELSRESRKILITAWVEDWTIAATSTICDDYGNAGDPVVIQNKKQLLEFLMGDDNQAGTVAIIQPREMDLDEDGDWPDYVKDGEETINGGSNLELKAMLNVAGAVITSKSQFIDKIASSGSILNGTFQMMNTAPIPTAIANQNEGTLERIIVTNASGSASASQSGLVNVNYGTISQCSSTLRVYGTLSGSQTQAYVGGIAAQSLYKDASTRPIIDACFVNASVDGDSGVQGGGIVGLAAGLVTNNTFEYGITLSQVDFKNIFHSVQSDYTLNATNNGWPTTAKNPVNSDENTNINVYAIKYDAVIDRESQLKTLLTEGTWNSKTNIQSFRISDNFTVNSATWNFVSPSNDYNSDSNGNVFFKLNGNNKTITLTGTADNENSTVELWNGEKPSEGTITATITTAPMLFNYIMGEIRDLTLYLDKPVVAKPSTGNDGTYNANDAIAPLAYAVYGGNALVSNVNVRSAADTYVQAATPAGLVVWALSSSETSRPTIENCKVEADVRMWLNYNYSSTSANMYAGGIVAMASKAIITQCKYRGKTDFTLIGAVKDEDYMTSNDKYPANGDKCYYGGIVGGTTTKGNDYDGGSALLTITDCSSWYETSTEMSNRSHGSIIGISRYSNSNHDLLNGMAEGNTGNWWQETSKGVAETAAGVSEEKSIGKRNSLRPEF